MTTGPAAGFAGTGIENHPGHRDQKSHGRKGAGSLHASDEALHKAYDYDDEATGMSARVGGIYRTDFTVVVSIKIRDRSGADVGMSVRSVSLKDTDTVFHDSLYVQGRVQGQGFATRFNAHAEAVYREHGIGKIGLKANVDVGGYAWARAGYGFKTGRDRTRVAKHATETASRMSPQVRAQVARIASNPHASPIDFAMIGHAPGATTWPGKEIMLGTEWDGVKEL